MEHRIKENTLMTKQNIFYHHIVPYLGEMKLDEITPKDIIHWQDQVMKDNNYKQTYLKTIHNQLSALFNYAIRFYGLKNNPARLAGNMSKEKVSEIKFWAKEEYLTFSRAMMNKEESYHAFEILYWCGIRLGELLALTAEDFDFVSIPWWRSHPIHENRATESIWTEPCNPLLSATKSTKRATSA